MRKILLKAFLFFSIMALAQTPAVTRALNHGLGQAQDAATLPVSRSKNVQKPTKTTPAFSEAKLIQTADNEYKIVSGWKLQRAGKATEKGAMPFLMNYDASNWYNATVPGTVLTTLVNEGVYPDPYFGINNVKIPDSLARTDWWYRVELNIPEDKKADRVSLLFKGINYRAEVWLNGQKAGEISGAFIRGQFDVTNLVRYNQKNVLTARIIPPYNPGISHEQSVAAGMGKNGGLLCLDGPTFFASQGWDWIPGIKDRNIGLWQDVCLHFGGALQIGDPQILTDLPLPDTTKAAITVKVPVRNTSTSAIQSVVNVNMDKIAIQKTIEIQPNSEVTVVFTPEEFAQLTINKPRLWWPNGYGAPNLYTAQITVGEKQKISDKTSFRFGIREFEYQLHVSSLKKERVDIEFNPMAAYSKQQMVFDQINVMRIDVNGKQNYLPQLVCATDNQGIKLQKNTASPYMILKVNGVPVFCKGGNWGMDDAMKRISRESLEPALKLHKAQHFNMIRNWTGQSTGELFYELCDEYGMLVFNEFWMSTTDFNVPPADFDLFMTNATDAVKRFRNHACIALWCARNEGFAPEELEKRLTNILITEDGTRHYLGSSIKLNSTDSGPWESHEPDLYSDSKSNLFAQGFKSEVGTSSVPTYRTLNKFMEKEDQWPVGDAWSYHDWHVGNWPGFQKFQHRLNDLYGEMGNAKEYCDFSQLENYRAWRAIGEAWNENMWNNTTGYLLWMSHPSWPSTVWQTYTYDYETTGAYYGMKKSAEPVHIQMNPNTKKISVVNAGNSDLLLSADYKILSLEGKEIASGKKSVNASKSSVTACFDVSATNLPAGKLSLLRLKLTDKSGKMVSQNEYWLKGNGLKTYQELKSRKNAVVEIQSVKQLNNNAFKIVVANKSEHPALGVNLHLKNTTNDSYILPTLFSEGYFTILAGEKREVVLEGVSNLTNAKVVVEWINE